jgi:hypothetical protein
MSRKISGVASVRSGAPPDMLTSKTRGDSSQIITFPTRPGTTAMPSRSFAPVTFTGSRLTNDSTSPFAVKVICIDTICDSHSSTPKNVFAPAWVMPLMPRKTSAGRRWQPR